MDPNKFYVLRWDFNTDSLENYDVLPFFRNRIEERKQKLKRWKRTKWWKTAIQANPNDPMICVLDTPRKLYEFLKMESHYQFWGRCEYEICITGFPVQENTEKIDVHEQIMYNLDLITEILYKEIC